jgi:hypothetical protein
VNVEGRNPIEDFFSCHSTAASALQPIMGPLQISAKTILNFLTPFGGSASLEANPTVQISRTRDAF